jgi:hypothetical protein
VAGTQLKSFEQYRATTQKEEMIMAGQILIPFNSHLRIKETLSVIKEAAKPGMRVVFLVRYPVGPWAWFRDHWVTTESARDAMVMGRKVIERYSWEGQRALAEEMVAPWRYALQKIGVEATVKVYTGSLSSAVENHSRGDGIPLLIRARNDLSIMGFLRRPIAFILKAA